jgi:hypothetical protein
MSDDKVWRKTFETVLEKKQESLDTSIMRGRHNSYYVVNIIEAVKSKGTKFLGHVFYMRELRNTKIIQ